MYLCMLFSSIKEINRLRKEIKSLLIKGMSNISLKVIIETFSKLRFSGFKRFVTKSVFRELGSRRYHWILIIKTKRNRKWKIPHTGLERRTMCFSSYKNRKLKVKLWWVWARERKKRAFFVKGNFLRFVFYLNV